MTARANRPTATIAETDAVNAPVYRLDVGALWHGFWSQGAAFWLLCLYFFFEYVRPQSIYPAIDVVPWIQIVLVLALFARAGQPNLAYLRNTQTTLLLLFWVVILLAWAFAYEPGAVDQRIKLLLNWLLVYILILTGLTTERRYLIFLLLFFLWNFKMAQHGATTWVGRGFSFAGWGVTGAPGWFGNSGEFGLQMTMFAAISFGFWMGVRQRLAAWLRYALLLLPLTAVMSVLASSSRGDLLGLGVAAAWMGLNVRGYRIRALLLTTIVAAIAYASIPPAFLERFATAGEDATSVARLLRWSAAIDILHQFPILGIGPENWMAYYPTHFPREPTPEEWGIPHSIYMDVAVGYGYSGLVIFAAMLLCTFRQTARVRRLATEMDHLPLVWLARGFDGATVGFMVCAAFMSVIWYPFFWVQVAMIAALLGVTRRLHGDWLAGRGASTTEPGPTQHAGARRQPVHPGTRAQGRADKGTPWA